MSDVYIPGIKSRFDTDRLIEGLMSVERLPRERTERNVEQLESQKGYWQEIGRRISSLREGARSLYSFQNPFTERVARSADESVITATATREAAEREYHFTVKQLAQADRFLSRPLEDSFRVEPGTYTFSVGKDEISFDFRGGTLKEFSDLINRRGQGRLGASLIAVERGARALLIESKVTGAENRLGFSGDSERLAYSTGMAERMNDSRREVPLQENTLRYLSDRQYVDLKETALSVYAGGAVSVPVNPGIQANAPWVIQFETLTNLLPEEAWVEPPPPPGPDIPPGGEITYGGVTIENDPASVPLPPWTPPSPPQRVDDPAMLSLVFSDGSKVSLPPVRDNPSFNAVRYNLDEIGGGRTLAALEITNRNTHRDISIRNIQIFNPEALGGFRPRNPVSTAQDALIAMEGIDVRRDTNTIDDLIPGVTVTLRGVSPRPVNLGIEPDREGVKDSVITLVGNYNRLMAEMNVLTRNDDRVIDELSYLSEDEREDMRKRLGAFSGDSLLSQFKNSLQRAAAMAYRTSGQDQDYVLLAQIGVSTDARRSGMGGGYDPARLRGYLEIDEKALDAALENKLPLVQELFGYDTDGDLIVDSGVAYMIESLSRPYVESGGFIALKTGTIDSRISQDRRRIETMDRQLAAREAQLKMQYGQMEGAYNRMEQLSNSLDNFSRQSTSGNNNR
ncbi:MAG: flagellar filament capping protein FliD [Treponema sp.]|jgi:flagellar hook-associated protein 2|nr:flagellar filament capping protein FliD [Treponema sp.]